MPLVTMLIQWTTLLIVWNCQTIKALSIWPQPVRVESGSSTIRISPGINVQVIREQNCSDLAWNGDRTGQSPLGIAHCRADGDRPDALDGVFSQRVRQSLWENAFNPWKFHPAHSNWEDDDPSINYPSTLLLFYSLTDEPIAGSMSQEAYSISGELREMQGSPGLNPVLRIQVHVFEAGAAEHAANTISQMFYIGARGDIYMGGFPFFIEDFPRFSHRGLNLDIARNEIGPEDVMRTMKGMNLIKLNTLHLHATDSQSWPIDIPALPELAARGSYRKEGIWSADALEKVQKYGQRLGIHVYLEIDMPGHTSSIHHSHPELIVGYGASLENYSASEPPSGQLKLNDSAVSDFVDQLLGDLLPRVSEYSNYFHLGGDELNTNIYALQPGLNTTDKNVLKPLLQDFYNHAVKRVTEHGLIPVFWQEALLDWNLTLPIQSLIQVWRPDTDLNSILSQDHQVLFGSASHWYLDCGYGTFLDYKKRQPSRGFQDWCSPYSTWRDVYTYDPLANVSAQYQDRIAGGEVHLWSELTDGVNLDSKLWPRVAAAAEVLWSGPGEVTGETTRRLAELRERLLHYDIRSDMVQMTWCLQNPGKCVVESRTNS